VETIATSMAATIWRDLARVLCIARQADLMIVAALY
jgi:hypothetical protein